MIANAMFIENGYAEIAFPEGARYVTTKLHIGRYVRIDDCNKYPQLCAGGGFSGATLIYSSPKQLARDCRAKLYVKRESFEAHVTEWKAEREAFRRALIEDY